MKFYLLACFLLVNLAKSMPQNRRRPGNLGSPSNPVGGFRPVSPNTDRPRSATNGNVRFPRLQEPGPTTSTVSLPITGDNFERFKPSTDRRPKLFLPAIPVSNLYIAPTFDAFGDPIEFEENLVRMTTRPVGTTTTTTTTTKRPIKRPVNSNLSPDLLSKLPIFGQVDILKATEELRSLDKNQKSLVSPGQVNAGVLPLAFEDPSELGLFPPLAKSP